MIEPANHQLIQSIRREVDYVFTIARFGIYVVPQLHRVLGINKTMELMKVFWSDNDNPAKPNNILPPDKALLKYGIEVINPIMNEVLKRAPNHPTFIMMLEFALKAIIARDSYCNSLK